MLRKSGCCGHAKCCAVHLGGMPYLGLMAVGSRIGHRVAVLTYQARMPIRGCCLEDRVEW